MTWPHDAEVTSIDSCNLGKAEAFSYSDDAGIHGPERQVRVASNKIRGTTPVVTHEIDDFQIAISQ